MDNRYNDPIDKEAFRENYRSIFGPREFSPGRQRFVAVEGQWVPAGYVKRVHTPLCLVRDSALDVEIHYASKKLKKNADVNMPDRVEKGYRSI